MNRSELSSRVAADASLSKAGADSVIDAVFSTITDTLEGVDPGGEALGDVVVSEVFAHDGGVFALDEGAVVGLAGAGLGELADMQLVE